MRAVLIVCGVIFFGLVIVIFRMNSVIDKQSAIIRAYQHQDRDEHYKLMASFRKNMDRLSEVAESQMRLNDRCCDVVNK